MKQSTTVDDSYRVERLQRFSWVPVGPCSNGVFEFVHKPRSQSIEAGSKSGLLTTTMRFPSDASGAHDTGGTAIVPGDREGDNDEQSAEFFLGRDVDVVDLEAPRLNRPGFTGVNRPGLRNS